MALWKRRERLGHFIWSEDDRNRIAKEKIQRMKYTVIRAHTIWQITFTKQVADYCRESGHWSCWFIFFLVFFLVISSACSHWAGLVAVAVIQAWRSFWCGRSHMNRCSYNFTGRKAEILQQGLIIVKEMTASGAIHWHLVRFIGIISGAIAARSTGCWACWNLQLTLLKLMCFCHFYSDFFFFFFSTLQEVE